MLNKKQIEDIRATLGSEETTLPLVLQALGNPCRFKIVKTLMRYHDLCVSDVAHIFSITVPAASQHLRVLERLGLVQKTRMGQMICYELRTQNPAIKQFYRLFSSKSDAAKAAGWTSFGHWFGE